MRTSVLSSRVVSVAAAAATVLLLAACSSAGNESEAQPTAGSDDGSDFVPSFAFITSNPVDFNQIQIDGMREVVEPLGGEISILDAGGDAQKQNQDCMDAITSGRYNGIMINPINGPGAVPCVDAAREADIPVVAVENVVGPDADNVAPQVDGVILSATTKTSLWAEGMADVLELACEDADPCNYIHTVGGMAIPNMVVLMDLLAERAAGGSNINLLALGEDQFNPETGLQVMTDLIAANPEVDVVMPASDSIAVLIVDHLAEIGRDDVRVVSSGASVAGLASIEEGGQFGTVRLVPLDFGRLAAQALVNHNLGEPIPTPEEVAEALAPVVITEENASEYEGQWG